MQEMAISRTIGQVRQRLEENGYSKGKIQQFNSTTNQLVKFMAQQGISDYSMDIGIRFIEEHYGFKSDGTLSRVNQGRLQDLTMLSGSAAAWYVYDAAQEPKLPHTGGDSKKATDEFLEHRRFVGIVERNMGTVELYLERFFHYLTSREIATIPKITGEHIQGYLRYISAFSNQSKDHMMRTVRQFTEFCWQNDYHPQNLASFAPNVHYDKRARIPSAYSYDDVMKILGMVDRNNPVGKRNYAILLLITRLGLRTGDVSGLRFENFDWEHNRLTLTQHKTGRPLTLPLLEDVGLAVIDYLKFRRPVSGSDTVFLSHKHPFKDFNPSSLYRIVSEYIHKAGLTVQGKKRGPHSLRHSLASRLLEENVPLPVISEILGHANTETTAVYLSIGIDQLRRCALEV